MAGNLTETDIKKILKRCKGYDHIDTFIETGTFRGETVRCMKNFFQNVHTIELSHEYFEKTSRLEADPRIFFHQGDSTQVLKRILPNFAKPVIFFLDAHFCHKGTARGEEEIPLLNELNLITDRSFHDLIIIDDVRLFGTNKPEDWSAISKKKILKLLRPRIPRWRWYWDDHLILDDRMIIGL